MKRPIFLGNFEIQNSVSATCLSVWYREYL